MGQAPWLLISMKLGTITLRAEIGDGDYLGAGNVTGTTSGNIGRFFPNQFLLSSDGVIDGCTPGTDFTYMDEPDLDHRLHHHR